MIPLWVELLSSFSGIKFIYHSYWIILTCIACLLNFWDFYFFFVKISVLPKYYWVKYTHRQSYYGKKAWNKIACFHILQLFLCSGPCQIPMMDNFFRNRVFLHKSSIIDVWQGPIYTSEILDLDVFSVK